MNHVIGLFEAAKIAARDDQQNVSGMALLLDFAKTNDSLGRSFLLVALRYLGLPDAFVRVVSLLHAGTRCRFSVNGRLSHWLPVSCGIRQGCPLAPSLFYPRVRSSLHAFRDGHPGNRGYAGHPLRGFKGQRLRVY